MLTTVHEDIVANLWEESRGPSTADLVILRVRRVLLRLVLGEDLWEGSRHGQLVVHLWEGSRHGQLLHGRLLRLVVLQTGTQ